jgi:hypothetical protein
MLGKIIGLLLSPLGWLLGWLVGKRTWNRLFLFLVNQAPRIWGGKYGARGHGLKSRDWFYAEHFIPQRNRAAETPNLLDDNAIQFAEGFFRYDLELNAVVGQLEQVVAEFTHGRDTMALSRLAQVIRKLKE